MISVQVLRAIAAMLVVIVHTTLKAQSLGMSENVFNLGHSGVDLFFIISGFIMMLISSRETNFKIFMIKRFNRLIPFYYIITTAALVIYLINPSMIKGNQDGISIINSYLLVPAENKSFLLSVGWTLSYEMFFYIVFASFLFIKAEIKGLFVASAISIIVIYGHSVNSILFSPILIEFCLGILCYYIYRYALPNINKNHKVIISCIFMILGFLFLLIRENAITGLFTNRVIELAIPMSFIFMSFIIMEDKINEIKNRKIIIAMKSIGDASYSLYLTHLFVIGLSSKIFMMLGVGSCALFVIFAFLSSLLVSIFVHKTVERKVINLFNEMSKANPLIFK
ncbi:acyltransferase family protein [Symbiopectobacterium sp. Eva_TO]